MMADWLEMQNWLLPAGLSVSNDNRQPASKHPPAGRRSWWPSAASSAILPPGDHCSALVAFAPLLSPPVSLSHVQTRRTLCGRFAPLRWHLSALQRKSRFPRKRTLHKPTALFRQRRPALWRRLDPLNLSGERDASGRTYLRPEEFRRSKNRPPEW